MTTAGNNGSVSFSDYTRTIQAGQVLEPKLVHARHNETRQNYVIGLILPHNPEYLEYFQMMDGYAEIDGSVTSYTQKQYFMASPSRYKLAEKPYVRSINDEAGNPLYIYVSLRSAKDLVDLGHQEISPALAQEINRHYEILKDRPEYVAPKQKANGSEVTSDPAVGVNEMPEKIGFNTVIAAKPFIDGEDEFYTIFEAQKIVGLTYGAGHYFTGALLDTETFKDVIEEYGIKLSAVSKRDFKMSFTDAFLPSSKIPNFARLITVATGDRAGKNYIYLSAATAARLIEHKKLDVAVSDEVAKRIVSALTQDIPATKGYRREETEVLVPTQTVTGIKTDGSGDTIAVTPRLDHALSLNYIIGAHRTDEILEQFDSKKSVAVTFSKGQHASNTNVPLTGIIIDRETFWETMPKDGSIYFKNVTQGEFLSKYRKGAVPNAVNANYGRVITPESGELAGRRFIHLSLATAMRLMEEGVLKLEVSDDIKKRMEYSLKKLQARANSTVKKPVPAPAESTEAPVESTAVIPENFDMPAFDELKAKLFDSFRIAVTATGETTQEIDLGTAFKLTMTTQASEIERAEDAAFLDEKQLPHIKAQPDGEGRLSALRGAYDALAKGEKVIFEDRKSGVDILFAIKHKNPDVAALDF